jgi:hypothetical protein
MTVTQKYCISGHMHLHQTSSYFLHHVKQVCQILMMVAGKPGLFNQIQITHLTVGMQTYALVSSKQTEWYQVSFQGVKQLGCEVDHSPPPTAKVNNEKSYICTPPYMLSWHGTDMK